jgi:endonuclease/exonuclease/phosphatase family metal-dependent hydrolase
MRVLTQNLFSHHGDWPARRLVLRDGLRELGPDVAALQEQVGPAADQVADLLGPGYETVEHPGRSDDGVGAVLASRWPVVASATLDLREGFDDELPWSAAVVAELDGPEPIGRVLAVHHKPAYQLDAEAVRERQAVACARFVAEVDAGRHLPSVVLGDFDAAPDRASIRFWTGRQSLEGASVAYADAWELANPDAPLTGGHTLTPLSPLVQQGSMPLERGRRIDYVLVGGGSHGPRLDVVTCRRVFDRPVTGVWASDHFGVVADLIAPRLPPVRLET